MPKPVNASTGIEAHSPECQCKDSADSFLRSWLFTCLSRLNPNFERRRPTRLRKKFRIPLNRKSTKIILLGRRNKHKISKPFFKQQKL